jgi:hypothetical protein
LEVPRLLFDFDTSRWALKIVVGAREQGTGNRKRVLSDFTFLHIPLNFNQTGVL